MICRFQPLIFQGVPSLKLTLPLKMDGWNTSFFLGWPIFTVYVSLRECNSILVVTHEIVDFTILQVGAVGAAVHACERCGNSRIGI